MADVKVQSLIVRPLRSADLAFPIAGIVEQRSDLAYLGIAIEEKEFSETKGKKDAIYNIMRDSDPDKRASKDTGKLTIDSSKIAGDLTTGSLFILRNEIAKSSLDQMVYQRQNAFLERYKHNESRLKEIRKLFPTSATDPTGIEDTTSKLGKMQAEFTALQERYTALIEAYQRTPVLSKDGGDEINRNNVVVTKQKSETATQPIRVVTPKHTTQIIDKDGTTVLQNLTAGVAAKKEEEGVRSEQRDPKTDKEYESLYKSQEVTTFYSEFVHPYLDNIIGHERAQVELMTEMMTDALYAVRVNHLSEIWENELKALDQEVEKFQTSFIHTFLLPPFPGVVTAVYKDVGENVQAGEPVIRIEDNSKILLVGIINYRGVLRLGDVVKIRTGDLFEDGEVLDIPDAKIVSIRGHDSDNDFWDLIFQCDNPQDAAKRYRLPINYHFDRDNIEITI